MVLLGWLHILCSGHDLGVGDSMSFDWEWEGPDLDIKITGGGREIKCKCQRGHCFHVQKHFRGEELGKVYLADTVGIKCCKCGSTDTGKVMGATEGYELMADATKVGYEEE